jgi:hypothetical protein
MKARTILFTAALIVLILGSLWWRRTPIDNAAAIVMLSESDGNCAILKQGETSWQPIRCSEVFRYLRGTLHLAAGNSIGITASGNVSQGSINEMTAHLKQWDYRVAGVIRVRFITEPEPQH